jgi:serine/threonine protein kinase
LVAARAAVTKTLGRYQLVKHLAQGGMADVLLARTNGIEGFERHVVLKRIREDQARDARYVEMFLDEARLAAMLHHHNVVQVNDIGQENGEYFFAMEYVHGEDVRALLSRISERSGQLPLEHVLAIVCAAAAGLHHAHEQRGPDRKLLGIVHRDVSPMNILIGYDGGVKVADFGIAKAAHRTTETRSGTLKGKVAYMSPEQCVGEAVDRRSDVFSLGIVLYELLTVRRLFKAENDFLTMTAIVLGYIPPPSKFRRDLPPELEAIVFKALANKPEDRYATAQELRLALEHLAAKLQLAMSSTGLADYMKQVFGYRPEPWLDDEDEPEIEVNYDFDGSASGIVQAPPIAEGKAVLQERRRAATMHPAPTTQDSLTPVLRTPRSDALAASVDISVESFIAHTPTPKRRRWGLAIGALAAVAMIAVALVVIMRQSDRTAAVGKVAPKRVTTPRPAAAPLPAPAPRPVPKQAAPAPASTELAPAETPPPRKIRKTKRTTTAPAPARTPKPSKRWDPTTLFPE